ncbi:MAG TPA: hypothetical protein VIY48_17260 [Candidatus Paceibacterota bacterium]
MEKISDEVISAILAGVTHITRRCEIYESDGETLWLDTADTSRIISGSVTVDYSRDERRAFEAVFENSDGVMSHNPDGGFWYDKIVKFYRGVTYEVNQPQPKILIIEDISNNNKNLARNLRKIGFTNIVSKTVTTVDDTEGYDIVATASDSTAMSAANAAILQALYTQGRAVFSTGRYNTGGQIPFITGTQNKTASDVWQVNKFTADSPLSDTWKSYNSYSTELGILPNAISSEATPIAWHVSQTIYTALIGHNTVGGRWFHYQPNILQGENPNAYVLIANGIEWLYHYSHTRTWEAQIGEFHIDIINEDNFPYQIKVTGRDGTKTLLGAKFTTATTFTAGTALDDLVKAIALAGGIKKFIGGSPGVVVNSDFSFERNTERWKAIKDICAANSVEVFFNAEGYLVTRPRRDPVASPPELILSTGGDEGNLATYSKSANDSRVYNTVVVTGTNADDVAGQELYQTVLQNTEPTSPTRVERLGPRQYFYTSSFFTSQEQVDAYALKLLKIVALEEFELNFSMIPFPWLEAGDIAEFIDPRAGEDEPRKYLISTLAIPLAPGPMSGTGKRVTIVGGGSIPGGELIEEPV